MSLDFTRGRKPRKPMTRWQRRLILVALTLTAVIYYMLSAVTIVLNGTTSLPHSGYLMITWPKVMTPGIYVAFDAPSEIAGAFDDLVFVKRVVGLPGDEVKSTEDTVCVNGDCRTLLPDMQTAGYTALQSHIIEPQQYVAFGDTDDSLDSRYAAIGAIEPPQIVAVGYPIKIPHWKEVGAWLGTH